MRYVRQLILCCMIIVLASVTTQAASVQGRYYTIFSFYDQDDDNAVRTLTHRPGFMVHEFGDADIIQNAVGVLEYELTQEAIDKKMKAYFYMPNTWDDYIPEEGNYWIDFHITNTPELTLEEIINRRGMVLAHRIDALAHAASFDGPPCTDRVRNTAFADTYPFSACHYKPIEIDFFRAQNAPTFKAGETLTIVVSFRDAYFWATTLGGTSDPYGLFAAGVRLSDEPLQPMASADDVEKCNGKTPTILGTHNDDTIHIPSDRNHVVLGLSGDDVIIGSERRDTICGGANNDKLHGHGGDDYLKGGGSSDMILAGKGDDKITDTAGHNILIGAGGNDDITGSKTSTCAGNGGRDRANRACGVKTSIEVVRN